ncbi:phage tail tape measure protein [Actinomadura rayongensis]|uniref:CHAP domain-containing protein n=1 Tax=Actinomadura rayongensis TaxID=1429076 RepID=A0A6I4WHC2_9ACTN|nr:phage tail tape measure protein [Actinomadura rayongensis]MXQ67695.1 CHAP domain-containing protein [Actinomadura rayongensis]
MANPIGAVYLAVLPDLAGFGRETARQLGAPVRQAAAQAGRQASDTLGREGTRAGQTFGSKVSGAARSGLGKLRTVGTAAGAAAGAALAAGVSSALDVQDARATMQAQLGLTRKDAAAAGKAAGSLYAHAYGSSMQEVNGAVTSVIRNMDGMRGASAGALEQTTGRALTLARVMDADVGDVTRSVSQLMRTGLARSAGEAFDLITRGAQAGVDKSGDLLDTVNEYSVQWKKLGLTGPAAMGLLSQAIKAGARDSDVAADALKEFSIRAVDGSKTSAAGFAALGLDARQMTATFAKGGPAAAAGLETVLTRLRAVKDPADRSAAAVALFGTQAEDLGASLLAMDPGKAIAALGTLQGATDQAGRALGETSQARFTAFKRGLQQSVTDAIVNDGLPALSQLQKAGSSLGISPSGLVAAGAAVAGLAVGAKTVAATYGAARTVVSATSTVVSGAGAAWDTLRLRALYAGDAARKGGTMVRAAGTSVAGAGRAVWSTTTSLAAMTAGWVRSGAAATTSAAKQGGAWIANTTRAAWSAAASLGAMAAGYARAGIAATTSAARQLAAAAAAGAVRLAVISWTAAQWLLNAALAANPVGLVVLALVALGAVFVVLWKRSETFRSIVLGAWSAIKAGTDAIWNGGVKAVLLAVWQVISTVARIYIAIYKAIFLAAWWAIKNGAVLAWNVIKAVLTGMWKSISAVARFYIAIYSAIFSAAWKAIKWAASTAWGGIKAVIGGTLNAIRAGFDTSVTAIKRIWGGLKKVAADPVRFVAQTVYQGGIKRVWDALATKVGLPKLPDAPKFATGGVLGGYTPGHDSVMALLSPGEGILRPEAVRYLGAGWVHGINKAARQGQLGGPSRFAGGGIVGTIGHAVGGFIHEGEDLFTRGLVAAARAALNPIVRASESSPLSRTGWGQLITRVPRTAVDGVLGFFAKHESAWMNKLGPGNVVKVAVSQIGQGDRPGTENSNKYNDFWNYGPGTAWCANFVSWVLNKAGAGGRYPGYPSAAVAVYSGAMRKVPRDQARPGDLGFYEGAGRSHINIIERNDHGSLITIGGNEGHYVRRARRNDQSSVGRPKYARGGVVPLAEAASVFGKRDEDRRDRRDPLASLYRQIGPRTAALVSRALSAVRPMATGGIVTRPTLALVGEAGAELVAPLRGGTGDAARALAALPRPGARTPGSSSAGRSAPPPEIRVFIGDRELTDIVRVEIDAADDELSRQLYTRGVA